MRLGIFAVPALATGLIALGLAAAAQDIPHSSKIHQAVFVQSVGGFDGPAGAAQDDTAAEMRDLVVPVADFKAFFEFPPQGKNLNKPRCRQWCRQQGKSCKAGINQKAQQIRKQNPEKYPSAKNAQRDIKALCASSAASCIAPCG
jgi:hypothetical protein